jgi:hypothetical protein
LIVLIGRKEPFLRKVVTLVVLSVLAVGCDRGQPPPPPPPPPTGEVSPLARRDAPPEGVASQLTFFIGGDSGCVGYQGGPPPARIHLAETMVRSPATFLVCFPGFAAGQPLTLEVARPDGVIRRFVGSQGAGGGISVPVVPGDPFGRYVLRARQGNINASAALTVSPATEPTVVLIRGGEGDPRLGDPIELGLGGFPPSTSVRLHAYFRTNLQEAIGAYVTSFDVPTDRYGQATLTIPTSPDDPAGCYGFSWAGLQQVLHFFCFASRGPQDPPPAPTVVSGTTTATAGGAGEVVYRERFTGPGRWIQSESRDGSAMGQVGGQYRIKLSGPGSGVRVDAPSSPADVAVNARVEVDATKVSSRTALFGVTCRGNPGGPGVGGFYLGAIDMRGFWTISRVNLGSFNFGFGPNVPSPATMLARAQRPSQHTPAVRASGTNRVGLECSGGASGEPVTLLLYVNGYEVARVQDRRGLGLGRAGLWTQSSDAPVEVRFDNFAVTRP